MRRIVSSRRLIIVSFALFIVLGANAGVTGVAWPSMRADFSRPLADLGTLLAIGTGGYFLAGLMAGWLTRRFGIGRVLVSVLVVGTVALIGYGVVPNWPLLVSCAVAVGFTGGTVDAVTNAYTALHHDTRTMNLLHACFGLGATGGPLLVASILARGLSWKVAYFVLAVAEAVLVITVFRVRALWPDSTGARAAVSGGHAHRLGPMVLGLLGMFLLYVGIEITAGQWAYSLLTEGRGVGEFAAGIWVALYWGGLTGGRLLLGVVGDKVAARTILQLSMIGSIAGTVVFWIDPAGLGVVALPLLGFSFAGVFPTMVALTPAWVGKERAETVIGFQIAAASAGTALMPWMAGRIVSGAGLEALGPYLVALAVAMAALNWLIDRLASGQTRFEHSRSPIS
jgi:fucose permease